MDGWIDTRRISIVLNGGSDVSQVSNNLLSDGTTTISGYTVGGNSPNCHHYFVLAIYSGVNGNKPTKFMSSHTDSDWARVDFSAHNPEHSLLSVRFATSFISIDQAILNLQSEVGSSKSFEKLVDESRNE